MKAKTLVHRLVGALLLAMTIVVLAAEPALASPPAFVTVESGHWANLASTPTSAEKNAYNRALQAALDYANQENPIVVDISDLGLNETQARHVQYLLHSNGELFWIDTYNDANYTSSALRLRCLYDDATITTMRAKVDKGVNKVLKRVSSKMNAATKILTIHDYLIDLIDYKEHQKTAYTGLVQHQADCFGYALTMDLMLRRAGFETDMAYTFTEDHAWNMVKVSGKWYHIDLTWDHGYTGSEAYEDLTDCHYCHLYLLQPDIRMKDDGYNLVGDGHTKWWAHHKSTSKTYYKYADTINTVFAEKKYKLYISGFSVSGLKYKVIGDKKVQLVSVTGTAQKKASSISIPNTIKYKGVTYKVASIGLSALKNAKKATTLLVSTKYLSKARVKGCLIGSKVKKVRLMSVARKKKTLYKKYFAKSNVGSKKLVKVTY